MRISALPYLTPPDEAISHAGWQLTGPDGEVALPADVDHWDYQTTLHLAAAVSVDRPLVTDSCAIEPDSELALFVTAHSDHTRTERAVARLVVPHQDTFDLAVQIQLPGHELGGVLTLTTALVALESKALNELAPAAPGSILWRCTHKTQLEGIGSQFPTDAADFHVTRPENAMAGWMLNIDKDDPDALFMSSVRLTLNSGHSAIAKVLAGEKDSVTSQVQRILQWDVTRQLVYTALGMEEVMTADFEEGAVSLAAVLRNLLATIWPLEAPMTLRSWTHSEPARVEMHIQQHCRVLT